MKPIRIAPDSTIEEFASFALSVHNAACMMPIAMKPRDSSGVLIDDGEFIFSSRECDSLDCLFSGDGIRQILLREGRYAGMTMFASAVVNDVGQRIAAIGIIDTLGMLSLKGLVSNGEQVERQVGGRKPLDKHFILKRQ